MKIVFFHRKGGKDAVSIEVSFEPFIARLAESNEVKVYRVPYDGSNPIYLLKNILFIHRHSIKDGINHITGDIHYGILGLMGRPSVLTIHDDYAIRMAHRGWWDKVFKWIFWIYLPIKIADASVCITPTTLKRIEKYYRSPKLLSITHHSVSENFSDKHKPFNEKCPVILQVGTAPHKNLESTIKALEGISCKLVVLKTMTDVQKHLAESLKINYENKINLTYREVIETYDQSDIVVFPSSFEGLGLPILEAQASGKPVITTNREPMNWVAGDGAILLENPLDIPKYRTALLQLLQNEEQRNRLRTKGLENAKRFSLENAVNQYMELYQNILSKKDYK
jgi:glycosyltransferase involved in cell wall biosynthesis